MNSSEIYGNIFNARFSCDQNKGIESVLRCLSVCKIFSTVLITCYYPSLIAIKLQLERKSMNTMLLLLL